MSVRRWWNRTPTTATTTSPANKIRHRREPHLHPGPGLRPLRPRHLPSRKGRHREVHLHQVHVRRPRRPGHRRRTTRHGWRLEDLQVLRLWGARGEPVPGRLTGQRDDVGEVVLRHQSPRRCRNPHRRRHGCDDVDVPLHRLRPTRPGRYDRRRRDHRQCEF
jgi:hypothetical protein